MSIQKIDTSLWFCNMKKKMTIILKIKRRNKVRGCRQTSELEKAHSTGEFVIVAKFGDRVLRRLAFSLLDVIR